LPNLLFALDAGDCYAWRRPYGVRISIRRKDVNAETLIGPDGRW